MVLPEMGRRYPGAEASKWPPKAVGFPNLHNDQTQLGQSSIKPIQYSFMTERCIYIPSALISVGPQAQMEDAGKFASARTEKKKENKL